MRKLLALLLLLPLLAGANGRATSAAGATTHADVLAAPGHALQPPLPGLAAGSALLPAAPGDATRAPTRADRSTSDPLARAETPRARTRITQRHQAFLAYAHRLRRARANVPASYGTPPPTSTT